MDNTKHIRDIAINVLNNEAEAIMNLTSSINNDFIESVKKILESKGRVVLTGIGKSANIAMKIVATFNSTGTPAIFMHAADAIHGDLGIIQKQDIVICISKSGNTPEIKVLIPLIKNFGNLIIALTANKNSYLALNSDYILYTPIKKEACPNNLAPTTSTTAQLAIGDALAVCLLENRGFTISDFAKYHPGGALGKRLYMRVCDLYINNSMPKVLYNDAVKKVIVEISSHRLGSTAVLNENKELIGVITDGDLRRMLEKNEDISKLKAIDIMTKTPKVISSDMLAIKAFEIMKNSNITQLLVVDDDKYKGIVHLHDILKEGIV